MIVETDAGAFVELGFGFFDMAVFFQYLPGQQVIAVERLGLGAGDLARFPVMGSDAVAVVSTCPVQVVLAVVTPTDIAVATYITVLHLDVVVLIEVLVGVGRFQRWLIGAGLHFVAGYPWQDSLRLCIWQYVARVAVLAVANFFYSPRGCGYFRKAGQAMGAGIAEAPVTADVSWQFDFHQSPVFQLEPVAQERQAVSPCTWMRINGDRAIGVLQLQQQRAIVIDDPGQSAALGNVVER